MLVLVRKIGESLVIEESIVTVLKIDRGVVKLGIEATRDVTVLRSEVKKRLEDERDGQ